MFTHRVKSIGITFTIAALLGTGPVACSSVPRVLPAGPTEYSIAKLDNDYTIRAKDEQIVTSIDGIKLVSGNDPHAAAKTEFDMALEVQGLGVQFEPDRTYAYLRADRTFSSERTIGVRFRFQF